MLLTQHFTTNEVSEQIVGQHLITLLLHIFVYESLNSKEKLSLRPRTSWHYKKSPNLRASRESVHSDAGELKQTALDLGGMGVTPRSHRERFGPAAAAALRPEGTPPCHH